VTSPRLLLAAGTVAASLTAIGPGFAHNGPASSASPLRVGTTGASTLVVPAGASTLAGTAWGSPAVAARTHVTIVRVSDGAKLFIGSLQSFHSLPVETGTTLQVRIDRPAAYAGLKAGTVLRFVD
jgi:hypothetical protein